MDPNRNPFAPGAGNPPPELSGRSKILEGAETTLERIRRGRHHRSAIFVGLRGVGKTVLLNKIKHMAERLEYRTAFVEAPGKDQLHALLFPELRRMLLQLSAVESARASANRALAALRSFASVFKVTIGDVSISVDPAPDLANSGDLASDLQDLFIAIGKTARDAGKGAALFIDEVQYLSENELGALIVAFHRISQEQLPLVFFGAGLPQIAALAGDAKSYAERLFEYVEVGALSAIDTFSALREPIQSEEAEIDDAALELLAAMTEGYPYFVQEWGYQTWNVAERSPIGAHDAIKASPLALARLDGGFFRVRFDRLTPREKEYARALAELGDGPQKSGDVARLLGAEHQSVAPFRAKLIEKGMAYSPSYGDVAFTVPKFADFMRRTMPRFPAKD